LKQVLLLCNKSKSRHRRAVEEIEAWYQKTIHCINITV